MQEIIKEAGNCEVWVGFSQQEAKQKHLSDMNRNTAVKCENLI